MKAYSDVTALLMAARMLITDAKAWTRGANARDRTGRDIDYRHKNAICFCAEGALFAFKSPRMGKRAQSRLEHVTRGFVYRFNDNKTHKQVLALFDRAIEMER